MIAGAGAGCWVLALVRLVRVGLGLAAGAFLGVWWLDRAAGVRECAACSAGGIVWAARVALVGGRVPGVRCRSGFLGAGVFGAASGVK